MTPEERTCKLLCQIDLDSGESDLILQAITEAEKIAYDKGLGAGLGGGNETPTMAEAVEAQKEKDAKIAAKYRPENEIWPSVWSQARKGIAAAIRGQE